MKEQNAVLFDISSIYNDAAVDQVLQTAPDSVVECIVYEYMKVYHKNHAQIARGEFSNIRQCGAVLERLTELYGVYTSNNAVLELRRRLPNIYNALIELVSVLIKAVREYVHASVPREFIGHDYSPSINNINTKTWGKKYFLTYTQNVESLKWPQSLSK